MQLVTSQCFGVGPTYRIKAEPRDVPVMWLAAVVQSGAENGNEPPAMAIK